MAATKDKAIVLKYVKYSESALIVHTYTRKGGRQTFMVYGVGGKKRNALNYFQPLYLLDIDYSLKTKKDLQTLKEYRLSPPLMELSSDLRKTSIALFIADVLHHTLKEEHADENLFDFIESAILLLDHTQKGFAVFHLLFLVKLSRFLGYHFDFSQSNNSEFQWWDMKQNKSVAVKPGHDSVLSAKEIEKISELSQTPFSQLDKLEIGTLERNNLLKQMVEVYENYSLNFKTLSSYEVLKTVFG